MKTSGISAALPAQDLCRAKAFYLEKVGLQAVESKFLEASDGRVGLTIGDGVNQLFVYPAGVRSSGGVHAGRHAGRRRGRCRRSDEGSWRGVRGVRHPGDARQEHGIARTPDGGEGAWFKDSEGNLVGVVRALAG
jgi:catechol 2,3-dioxygenase-like lactoylglutathione lyase family enzyme